MAADDCLWIWFQFYGFRSGTATWASWLNLRWPIVVSWRVWWPPSRAVGTALTWDSFLWTNAKACQDRVDIQRIDESEALLGLGRDRDNALALDLAMRALDRTESAPGQFLQTLARAHTAAGNYDEALTLLAQAAEVAATDDSERDIASQAAAITQLIREAAGP